MEREENRTVLSNKKCAEIVAEQERKRCDEEQAVKTVQNTSVTREQGAIILDAKAALHC